MEITMSCPAMIGLQKTNKDQRAGKRQQRRSQRKIVQLRSVKTGGEQQHDQNTDEACQFKRDQAIPQSGSETQDAAWKQTKKKHGCRPQPYVHKGHCLFVCRGPSRTSRWTSRTSRRMSTSTT